MVTYDELTYLITDTTDKLLFPIKFMFGEFWKARNPIDFWRKWNPHMHKLQTMLHKKLGGKYKPIRSTMTQYISMGVAHEALFLYKPGAFTLFFTLSGIPVAAQKAYEKYKAKKFLRKDLEALTTKYQNDEITKEDLLDGVGIKKRNPNYQNLTELVEDSPENKADFEIRLLKNSTKYWRMARPKQKKKDPELLTEKIKKYVCPALTVYYVYSTLHGADILLEYLYNNI